MDHPRIITALDLESFADKHASQAILPELIDRLIRASCQSLSRCDIQDADHTNRPGFDAVIESAEGRLPYVPRGRSYWELSNSVRSNAKATEDLEKRTEQIPNKQRRRCSFVFATFREWGPNKIEEWTRAHSHLGWRGLLVLDSKSLSDWLCEIPPVARWLLARIHPNRHPNGWRTPAEHWEDLRREVQPGWKPIPTGLFMASRRDAVQRLEALFQGEESVLYLSADDDSEVRDFVSAVIAGKLGSSDSTWADRCVFIDTRDEWAAMSSKPARLVLLGDSRLELERGGDHLRREATGRGHAVIVPLTSGQSEVGRVLELARPRFRDVEQALTDAEYTRDQIASILRDGFTSLSVLKQRLGGGPEIPRYATTAAKRGIALACLVGGWRDDFQQDAVAVAAVFGMPLSEWNRQVAQELGRSASPIARAGGRWEVTRSETWHALGHALLDDDLDRFEKQALQVLSQVAPTLDTKKDESWMAVTAFGDRAHSSELRRGMVETLALLGSQSAALGPKRNAEKAEYVAQRVVRALLREADLSQWLSVHSLLPDLAEAAPEAFLDATEAAVENTASSPFIELLGRGGNGSLRTTYIVGLLRGLEALAWHPDYFSRVVVLLGILAASTPGDSTENRALDSLTRLLWPWAPQTTVDVNKRTGALRSLAREQPGVAWKLVLSLLPNSVTVSTGCRKPRWRTSWLHAFEIKVTREQLIEQVRVYSGLAIQLAADDVVRMRDLAERLPNLHVDAFSTFLDRLVPGLAGWPATSTAVVWEVLVALVEKHRAFPEAKWALPAKSIAEIEVAASEIEPKDAALRHRRLFGDQQSFFDGTLTWEESQERLAQVRESALREILSEVGIDGVLAMIESVKDPHELGVAFARVKPPVEDHEVLPRFLSDDRPNAVHFVGGFVWRRWQSLGLGWVDGLDKTAWTVASVAGLFALLPAKSEKWQRVDGCGEQIAEAYWRLVNPNPLVVDDVDEAASRLMGVGRERLALYLCSDAARRSRPMSSELAVRVLRACRATGESNDPINAPCALELITWLQEPGRCDQEVLFELEWSYLHVFDRNRDGAPKAVEARLAMDPRFFVEVVRMALRPDEEPEGGSEAAVSEEQLGRGFEAYRLLHEMRTLPGRRVDGHFDGRVFDSWLAEVQRLAADSGHLEGAIMQVGHLLAVVVGLEDWFVTMPEIVKALDEKGREKMRSAFCTQVYNSRCKVTSLGGRDELTLAGRYRTQADALDARGFTRIAATLRDLARMYVREAEWVTQVEDDLP